MTLYAFALCLFVGIMGHLMAAFWIYANKRKWSIIKRTIFDMPISNKQLMRELKNSWHSPVHAIMLGAFLSAGFFQATGALSFLLSGLLTALWAEIWHYVSHRAFHHPSLHWIHAEHHKSHLNSPLTAISFSFTEKFVFDAGILIPLAAIDQFIPLSFSGIAAWYIGYLVVNSFSHANFELKSPKFLSGLGKILTSTTYHSLHHARYTGNYGLGTRFLDKLFGTEWEDYERVYKQVVEEEHPLVGLRQKL